MQNYITILGIISMRQSGYSYSECRARYSLGSGTISLIMKRFQELGLSLSDLRQMEASKVEEAFYPPDRIRRKEIGLPNYEAVYNRIHAKGSKANLFFLWKEYKEANPCGYQYTQYVEHYNRYVKEHYGCVDVTMAVERIPGEKVYIDWVGDQPELIYNPETGEMQKVHVLITTVGVSSMIYAELFPNEKQNSFITGVVHALEYYGAVPKMLVPDNMKTAIIKHTKDELIINASFQDLEDYYDTIILPPPARKPKGKATVERYVKYLETELLERLKENTYTSFRQANEDTRLIVEAINNEIPKNWNISHRQAFENYDRPQMKSLSQGSFQLCEYVAVSSVPNNYHIRYDDHYYSVFYTYYQKPVILKATMTEIIICDQNNKFICKHERVYNKFPRYITKDEHMKKDHLYYKEVNERDGEYYRRWALAIGNNMAIMIDRILKSFKHEEQAYNSCNGILHACDNISRFKADEVAGQCLKYNTCTYTYFKKILNNTLNNETQCDDLPDHQNIWGKDRYK